MKKKMTKRVGDWLHGKPLAGIYGKHINLRRMI